MTQRGFTIIELLVVIAVSAILLGLAVPSFTDYVSQQKVKNRISLLREAVLIARAEAIKTKANVYVKAETGGWANGWFVTKDNTNASISACAADTADCVQIYNSVDGLKVKEANDDTTITISSQGRATPTTIDFRFCDSGGREGVTSRTLAISVAGNPSIEKGTSCDNDA